MFKKVSSALILALLLIGCSEDHSEQIVTAEGIEIRVIESFEELNLDPLYHISGFNLSMLHSSNRLTGEIRATFELEAPYEIIWKMQIIDNYYVAEVWSGDEAEDLLPGQTPQPIVIEFLIFNESLDVVETFRITEEDERIFSLISWNWNKQLASQNGEWLVYFSHINWAFGSTVMEFYAYNFHTQELTLMSEIEGSNFVVGDLHMMSSINQLAFILQHWVGEIPSHVELGFIDLGTFETNIVYSTDIFNSAMMDVFGEYLVVFENWPDEDTLESEVILIHSLTGEIRNIPLSGYRTVWPSLTTDSQLMFTSLTDWSNPERPTSRARLYDTQTADVVFEYMLIDENTLNENEGIIGFDFYNIDENIYIISAEIGEYDNRGWELERIRTEYMIIEIVVIDDE